ncbi:MFS transporter [Neisseria animalis]|uniref:MFS transporter n=1 Tax=Neisseria animalis TaxID=492 RepID=A0A5P3MTX1_NEIAN|nr:MFS transporter [Neisseria animalis]QEY24211.1 MFS transporter [Neisseria animalis]ROW32179.1 MFS transporter [Neisseria animalis]VEE06529.1 integral membrane protein [Neisseria animalis]
MKPSSLLKAAVFIIGMSAFIQVYSVQAVLPVLMADLRATEVQAGLAVGAAVLGVALMSPFMGMLSDAFGRKIFITASLLYLSLPTALLAFSADIHQMIALRFLQGLAVPGITVVLIAYIGEEFETGDVARLMAVYVSGTVFGGFMGRFLLGYLSEWAGWRGAFGVMAAVSLACALFVWQQLPKSQHFTAKPDFQTAFATLKSHVRNRYVVSASLLGMCVLCSLVGCFTYINLHLAGPPYRLNSSELADIFTVYLIGMVITPLSARLMARFGSVKTIVLAVCLSMAGVAITLSAPLAAVVVGLVLMSSGVFVTQAATINYIAAHVKQGRSLASGLYYMAYYSGGTIGALLCGLAYTGGQWSGVVYTLLAVQAAALLVAVKGMKAV